MVALSARTGGSRHTGLAALPHENNQKYAGVLDLDNLPNPTPVKNTEGKNKFDMAKTQIEKKQ